MSKARSVWPTISRTVHSPSPSFDVHADAVLRDVEESDDQHEVLRPDVIGECAYPSLSAHERDVLASYGPDPYTSGRQAARLVDKILKGANPTDIPVETNSKIEFIINLKTAKTLGLTIAPEVLFQATKVIR